MKPFPLNHAKLILTDSRHNWFHWLIVVIIRIFYSLIIVPLSTYSAATGFAFSASQLQPLLPVPLFSKIGSFITSLPYFPRIMQFSIGKIDYWYQQGFRLVPSWSWWAIVIGIPLILIGISAFVINFFILYYSIFSSDYNRTHCPFCLEAITLKQSKPSLTAGAGVSSKSVPPKTKRGPEENSTD